jgi:muconolactone delta-isomerase
MEYLVTMTTRVPDGTPEAAVQDIRTREAAHSRELAAQGHLLRLWRPPLQPGEWRTLGLFAAADVDRLEEVLASMPLRVWRTDDVTRSRRTRTTLRRHQERGRRPQSSW